MTRDIKQTVAYYQKKYKTKETKRRFENEILISKENASKILGIIPILEDCKKEYWYTMPIAQPIMQYIKDKEIEEIVKGIIQLTETLGQLHKKWNITS